MKDKLKETIKANDNPVTTSLDLERIILPVPELDKLQKNEMEIYARFMRHLRCVANSRMEIKILTAIQFTADMLDISDSEVTKTLVDFGLRAPRMAFPGDYLDHADNALMRDEWEIGAANAQLKDLRDHWHKTGEDKFAGFRRYFPSIAEDMFSRV